MDRIGRYEILEELGRGAMGAVYKARDSQIGRTVAVKVILTANLSKQDLDLYKQRFYREAQTAGKMSHPGIVTIHDIAEAEDGQPYLVMEFVPGATLEKLLSSSGTAERYALKVGAEPLPLETSLDMGIQLAEALDYAHRQGVIHRDIKPANILVAQDEGARNAAGEASHRLRVKIADFGIAKIAGTNLTQTGLTMGTPAFMSPEQVSMGPVDSRSDLFSLGGVLYWMLTGERPFAGESLTQITFQVVFGAPLPVAHLNPRLPPDLDVVLSRCLAKSPEDRYATGREMAADLELVRAGKPLKTTLAPVSDITLMQSNPLPVVAADLPPEQRLPQTPLPLFTDHTVRVGSQTGKAPAEPAPEAISPKRDTVPIAPPATAAKKSRTLLGVAAVLVVLVVAGYFLTQRKPADPIPQPSAPTAEKAAPTQAAAAQANVPPPPPEPSKLPDMGAAQPTKLSSAGKTAPAKSEESKAATKKATVAGKASLQIDCRNNFEEATLIVTVDGKQLLKEKMVDKKPLTVLRPVGAGEHSVLVRVISEKAKFDQEQKISGEFGADGTRVLVIDFGKGSGLGLRGRKLGLKWGS